MNKLLRSGLAMLTLGSSSLGWILPAVSQAEPDVIVYRCDQGKGFEAVYLQAAENSVEAMFGSKVIVLPQVPSGSGATYSDGSVTLVTQGNEAFVEVGNKRLFTGCIAESEGVTALW